MKICVKLSGEYPILDKVITEGKGIFDSGGGRG